MSKRDNIIKWSIIGIFVGLYTLVSIISTIHVIDFFRLSNPNWLAITLAIAFEIGAAASLAAIVILDKTSKSLVWMLFLLITGMQMMGNMYYAYVHLEDYLNWSELFGIMEEEVIFQKRVLSIVSGAILPVVALGFIKSLVDYIKPSDANELKSDYQELKDFDEAEEEIEMDIAKNIIEDSTDEDLQEEQDEIELLQNDKSLSESERNFRIEKNIKKVISENPELKEKISEKLKEIDGEDKYNKTGGNFVSRNVYGGM
tara:strand:+ start:18 stop:791 length:774 start_codon:yes stop_codon:yes gene_type:complete